ncbi:MAG: hypothetical protein J3K34DRAFT_470496 [Monoraphidium minutum]|nr:MAG: hypothetical protein J3K34DRAFT_470496 [Monoraphidium minutum]
MAARPPRHTPEAAVTAGAALGQAQQQHQQQQQQEQQHEQRLLIQKLQRQPPAPAAAPRRPPPFAALTRLLLTGSNSYYFRNALTSQRRGGGPISLLLFLLTIVAAMVAAVRGALVRKVKACRSCRGFGVSRCRLCDGEGRVDWAAKLSHYDVCPLCMNRRYVVCSDCGGFYHRPLFKHMRRNPGRAADMNDVYLAAEGGASFSAAESSRSTRND